MGARCLPSCSFTTHPQQDMGENKMEEVAGWDKHSLIWKAKAACGSKAKRLFVNHFPSADMANLPFLGMQGLSMHRGWLGRHTLEPWMFLHFLIFPQLLLLSMLYSLRYPFDQFGSAVRALSHPNLLPTSLPTGLCNGCCWRGNLDVVPAQFSISQNTKTLVCYQHSLIHNCKAQ